MKNSDKTSDKLRRPKGPIRPFPGATLNLVTLFSFIACVFFLLTNGIPLVNLGWLADFGSKSRYVNTMRASVIIFAALMVLIRLKSSFMFEHLWLIRMVRGILRRPLGPVLIVMFLLYSAALITVGFMRHAALETRAFDLGIFSQAVWTTLQGDFLYSSIKGGICLLGDHVSPILALLTPFYQIWPDPRMLLMVQTLAAASCIFIIAWIAKEKTQSSFATLLFVVAYCFYLPTRNALHEDFHPEVLVDPFILLAFIFLERKRIGWFLLSLVVVISAKENMLMISFIFGFYAMAFKKMKSFGVGLMLVSIVMFFMEVKWLVPKISGQPYLYQGFYQHLLTGTWQDWIGSIINGDNVEYILKVFAPVLFLSFFHGPTLILTSPILVQNLLSSNDVFRSFAYHYTTGLTPFVFISAVYGWVVVMKKFPWLASRRTILGGALLMVSLLRSGPSEYYYFWQSWSHYSPHRAWVRKQLNEIPVRARVVTHNNFIPQLSERKYVYQFDYNDATTKSQMAEKWKADYVIFDREFWEPGTLSPGQSSLDLQRIGYELIVERDGFYIFKHPSFEVR